MHPLMSIQTIQKLSTLTIYRLILKNMKKYPAKNRHNILIAIQQQFRDNQNIQQIQKKQHLRKKAQIGLRHIIYYIVKNQDLMKNQYHNTDFIQPFAKKKQDLIYF